ncbi:MAG: DUF2461 domain-containing protein [Crocinitomicaceae bacterium]
MPISKNDFNFLNKLEKNNDRDWFTANKEEYQTSHESLIAFADAVLEKLNRHDVIETLNGKKSLYRIYRDVRFSKDKAPYKTHWAGGYKRATVERRGGYFFHIAPNNGSFVAGGFWAPSKEDLQRIREEIAVDDQEMRDVLADNNFTKTFGRLVGEQLKSAPKGFAKEHKAIDLLRFKQFVFSKNFTDEEVLSPNFADKVDQTFKAMRPFFDYMSDVLTTDINGEKI